MKSQATTGRCASLPRSAATRRRHQHPRRAASRPCGQPPRDGCLPIVLFLTDGLPDGRPHQRGAIRELVEQGNPHHRRIFTFGVGDDVNAPLLDRIADVTRAATTTYVLPGEDVEVKVAATSSAACTGRCWPTPSSTAVDAGRPAGAAPRRRAASRSAPRPATSDDQLVVLGQYRDGEPAALPARGRLPRQERALRVRVRARDRDHDPQRLRAAAVGEPAHRLPGRPGARRPAPERSR